MKRPIPITVLTAALLLITFNAELSTVLAQGSLTPPGTPAPMMKTLAQIEPRIPISSASYTIAESGSYYLTANLNVTSGNGITIAADGVTLDLNGFTITSTAPSAIGYGIQINGAIRNLTIMNGFVSGGVTNNGSGSYSGSGFQYGIGVSIGNEPVNVRVLGVSVSGCLFHGIYLGEFESTVVDSCTVGTVGNYGIVAATIKSSVAKDCGNTAISGRDVSDSQGSCTGNGFGVSARTAQNCYGQSIDGIGVNATTAQNCYGVANGCGLSAETALNCYGESSGGNGFYATTAQNCSGKSSGSGSGLYATSAQNCYGWVTGNGYGIYVYGDAIGCRGHSNGGVGLTANIANTCSGSSFNGTGLSAQTANSCSGSSVDAIGLSARIANTCFGSSINGAALSVTYKYNMP